MLKPPTSALPPWKNSAFPPRLPQVSSVLLMSVWVGVGGWGLREKAAKSQASSSGTGQRTRARCRGDCVCEEGAHWLVQLSGARTHTHTQGPWLISGCSQSWFSRERHEPSGINVIQHNKGTYHATSGEKNHLEDKVTGFISVLLLFQ